MDFNFQKTCAWQSIDGSNGEFNLHMNALTSRHKRAARAGI